ncbi:hypothetical protein AURDEDRAFT_175209 [Auricularia subglabra TFB-10046 SS5]|nr:hypothetical protein AURDEDRAFT_175209 [Auricularia subglabra TFB-10046 SS5]
MSPVPHWTDDAGLKLLTSPPVYDAIYASCNPTTLARVAKTCHGAHAAVDDYTIHAFNVTKLLAPRFFSEEEVIEFRNLQARLQFLISGSMALQLLDQTRYPNSDLDVYTFPNDAEVLGRWLLAHGWTYRSLKDGNLTFDAALAQMPPLLEDEPTERRERREKYASVAIRELFHFKRTRVYEDGRTEDVELQIIVADLCPMQAILAFHSTVVMNYIAWDHACALYPLGSLEERRALVTYDKDRKFKLTMMKYASRGFRIDSTIFTTQTTRGAFRFGTRFVGDGQCWTIKLDTTDIIPPPSHERHDMAVNGWTLGYHQERPRVGDHGQCAISSHPLRSLLFRHRYCIPAEFFEYLQAFMRRQGRIEWTRFGAADLPQGVAPGYGRPKPEGFTYWDEYLLPFKESFLASLALPSDTDIDMVL